MGKVSSAPMDGLALPKGPHPKYSQPLYTWVWTVRVHLHADYFQQILYYQIRSWLSGEESTCDAGDAGSIPGLGRSSGKGNDHPLWYSCLGNPMDREAWQVKSRGSQRVRHDWATECTHTHFISQHMLSGGLRLDGIFPLAFLIKESRN